MRVDGRRKKTVYGETIRAPKAELRRWDFILNVGRKPVMSSKQVKDRISPPFPWFSPAVEWGINRIWASLRSEELQLGAATVIPVRDQGSLG